jgi:four helix bundle protein
VNGEQVTPTEGAMEGLDKLEVWKKAKNLAEDVYREILPLLPIEEKYGLNSQIRRAAASIPANIAEGYGRFYYQETIRFCYVARGSLMELMSHLDLANSLSMIDNQSMRTIQEKANILLRLLHGYIKYLKKSKRGQNEPGSNSRISDGHFEYDPTIDKRKEEEN